MPNRASCYSNIVLQYHDWTTTASGCMQATLSTKTTCRRCDNKGSTFIQFLPCFPWIYRMESTYQYARVHVAPNSVLMINTHDNGTDVHQVYATCFVFVTNSYQWHNSYIKSDAILHRVIKENHVSNIGDLVQNCRNSSALAMELLQSCAKPSISSLSRN